MQPLVIDPRLVKDLALDILGPNGAPRVLPAAYYHQTTIPERALFGMRHGVYGLPTEELVAWVKNEIGGRTAIEIGAGHGAFAEALGIPATDSCLQNDPTVAAFYAALSQPVVSYGKNVEKLTAKEAIAKYRPQVVVASWVTHIYREDNHAAGGNMFGVDEEELLAQCETYIFVGNTKVHRPKPISRLPHTRIEPDWVYSRASNGSADFIAVWNRT